MLEHVERCLMMLDPKMQFITRAICRGGWYETSLKDLRLLPTSICDPDLVVLVDNSVLVTQAAINQSIVVPDFVKSSPSAPQDTVLPQLAVLFEHMVSSLRADKNTSVVGWFEECGVLEAKFGEIPGHGFAMWQALSVDPTFVAPSTWNDQDSESNALSSPGALDADLSCVTSASSGTKDIGLLDQEPSVEDVCAKGAQGLTMDPALLQFEDSGDDDFSDPETSADYSTDSSQSDCASSVGPIRSQESTPTRQSRKASTVTAE
eukprot:NODE_1972_length_1237_cov_5.504209_g1636_i0.p1 GENE.NODE_1972_length_1237_cov_5.504209_g1636_i0~~NODE_1972_length_1237_cov_5.504209_g1636_i0.p1  ORF type:complete len:263 (+),score=54.32 NODE_1972_length_1237_cov_5.504209_g1636_i0:349-1137(+)